MCHLPTVPVYLIMLQIACNLHLSFRGVPIYRIGKILAADMAKFSISAISVFEIVPIFLPMFYTPLIG